MKKPFKAYLITIIVITLSILAVFSGVILVIQDRLLFMETNDPESREYLRYRPGFSEVEFTSKNGKTYNGVMYTSAAENAPLVIYFGGNADCSYRYMRGMDTKKNWRYFAGWNYLCVDYEGYGINSGHAHYLKMYEHALAVYDYALTLSGVDSERIVTMGFSLGTGSAVYLAANRPVAAMILAAPYANGYDLYNSMIPVFAGPLKLLVKQKLPSDKYAADVKCPVLVFASRADEMVPFASSRKLVETFPGQVDFVELDNVSHNSIFGKEGVYDRIQSFLGDIRRF